MEKNKRDFWDKLGIIGTFLSSTLIVIFSTIVTWHTNKLSNKVEEFKTVMDENRMINELVKQISNDSVSTVKYDFALLALERYLRNTSTDGQLKQQDKEMLVGFAQSLILDRKNFHPGISESNINQILIPKQFLEKYDSARLNAIKNIIANNNKKSFYPPDSIKIDNKQLLSAAPVSQSSGAGLSGSLNLIVKKIVYIQYSNRTKLNEIKKIQEIFIRNKWTAPGIEYVNGNYENIIKYFRPEDREIAKDANNLLGNKYKLVAIKNEKYEKIVPKGQIEVWVSEK